MKNILITGANSYIGESVRDYLQEFPDSYSVTVKNSVGWEPVISDFAGYDVVLNVAGIAHRKETSKNRQLYYSVNRNLVVTIAKTAKAAGVKQFILLSSMSVYGMVTGSITKDKAVNPKNAYGRSKAEADEAIKRISDDSFKFACLRLPIVYGKDCKGNYQRLRKFALISPFFPKYSNQRSMIYIGNLCEFVKGCIDYQRAGIFFPQNKDYVNTSDMVRKIAECHGKKIWLTVLFNWAIRIAPVNTVKRVFGDLTYESVDTVGKYGFEESIHLTEECLK